LEREALGGLVEGLFEKVQIDGFGEDGDGAGILGVLGGGPGGDENDAGGGILGNDVAAGGGAVQFRHPIVHQDDVGLVAIVGLNGFEAGANHFDDFMLAMRNQRRQRCSHTSLIVGDEYAHAEFAEVFMPKTEAYSGEHLTRNFRIEPGGDGSRRLCVQGKQRAAEADDAVEMRS